MQTIVSFILILFVPVLVPILSVSEEYPLFDGRKYNGLFYPKVNVVEWGEPAHLVFNIYSKNKPVDISGKVIRRGANKVFLFAYDLSFRGERRCRSVLAPETFKVGQELHFYQNRNDKELDQIIVSAEAIRGQRSYKAVRYSDCKEIAANTPKIPKTPKTERAPVVVEKEPAAENRRSPAGASESVWYSDAPVDQRSYDWFGETPSKEKKKQYLFD